MLTTDEVESLKALVRPFGKLRTYPNDMRSDGVFVAEDAPIEPYSNKTLSSDGRIVPAYPATPQKAWGLDWQVEHDAAAYIVAACNALPELLEMVATDDQS